MPAYAGASQATEILNNRQGYFWLNEAPPVNTYPGSLSVAYQLQRINQSSYPWGACFEATFSGNPGAFEIDIVGANTDNPQNYIQLGTITQANSYVPGYYVGRWDMPSNMWVRYVAAFMKSLTNAVNVTLTVNR
jgi:hypothetical protein